MHMWFDAPESNNQCWSWLEKLTDNTSSLIPEPDAEHVSVVFSSFFSVEESPLDVCCLFQQSFFKCPDFPQSQHFTLLFFPFDFDRDLFYLLKHISLGWPLTIIASDVEVYEFDLFLVSLNRKAPTTSSNSRVSDELRLIEVTKWSHDSVNEHNKVIALSSDSNFTSIRSNYTKRVLKVFRWSLISVPSFMRKLYNCLFRRILLGKDLVMYNFSTLSINQQ